MSLKSQLVLFSSTIGDVLFGSAQAGAVGASWGNGAATFGTNAQNPNQMGDDGNIVVNISSAGVSPNATGADKILAILTVPANGFDIANRGLQIMAGGNCPNNNSKTFKIVLNPTTPTINGTLSGGTTIASFTATGAGSTGGWNLQANLFKYGAAGSNTQIAIHESGQAGNIVGSLAAPSLTTVAENASLTVVITGNSGTTNGDIVYNFSQIFAMN
jgi:hypothetical protein